VHRTILTFADTVQCDRCRGMTVLQPYCEMEASGKKCTKCRADVQACYWSKKSKDGRIPRSRAKDKEGDEVLSVEKRATRLAKKASHGKSISVPTALLLTSRLRSCRIRWASAAGGSIEERGIVEVCARGMGEVERGRFSCGEEGDQPCVGGARGRTNPSSGE
jgi:hypothetical protein